jgi:GntR family transcriptional regulator/MocR family aminotransferase
MHNIYFLQLPERSSLNLRDQICELISAAIAKDLFSAEDPLPSCRALSAHLGVSRNTVYEAYCRLIDIGLVLAKDRSGYYVNRQVSAREFAVILPHKNEGLLPSPLEKMWENTQRLSTMRKINHPMDWATFPYPFVYNQVDPKRFPLQEWRESMRAAMATSALEGWSCDAGETDSPNLVRQLRQRLLGYRGIIADPEEILITAGAQNAIFILAVLNSYLGRSVAIENPCYPEARNAFTVAGNDVYNVPVDGEGLIVDHIPQNVGLVYTTPSHHFPTTVTLSMERRKALIARAERDNFLICEDDYEAEMNFVKMRGRPIRALDQTGRTIYVGSLSKSVAPGLRLGYMVAHSDIIREAKAIRRSLMRHPPVLLQNAMAHFIASGSLDAHLRKMERRYKARWEVTLGALAQHLPEFEVQISQGGTCVWLTGPKGTNSTDLAFRLKKRGVLIDEGGLFYDNPKDGRNKFRIGFAALPKSDIIAGISIIAEEALKTTF